MSCRQFPEPRSAYIHVPFCAHRCGYCDFTLVAGRDDLIGRYLRALELELQSLGEPREVDTLYLGGGTPTHLEEDDLFRLLDLLLDWFEPTEQCEFTVEGNPAGLTDGKIGILADAGVNRISLGVQSFDASTLMVLERDHCAEDVVELADRLRQRISNVSFDLIFGVPGQSLCVWRKSLREALTLEPKHISTYGLTFEKGTAFWSRREKGKLASVPDDLERDMYAAAMDDLSAAGFEQYELSNFSLPGHRSRHNEVYWRGCPYYGFGPGAARYIDGCREVNHRSVTSWLNRVLSGESPIGTSERLTDEERARESIVLGLRKCCGIHLDDFEARTGFNMHELAEEAIATNCQRGLLEQADEHLRLTREGRFLADTVIVDFL